MPRNSKSPLVFSSKSQETMNIVFAQFVFDQKVCGLPCQVACTRFQIGSLYKSVGFFYFSIVD